jgi:hypothetical protein
VLKQHMALITAGMVGVFTLVIVFTLTSGTPLHAQSSVDISQQATTDPTVDAAVSTIFAQTQQADGVDMTAVVATAFSAAQTATAEGATSTTAEATPEATEEVSLPTLDVSTLSATVVDTFEMMAGPANTSAYLAPDGEKFVYVNSEEICLYTIDGQEQSCTPFGDEVRRMDRESVAWSRDSRYVAFALQALVFFIDSDIWVYDTVENQLINVTEDNVLDLEFEEFDSGDLTLDLSPRWSDDGRLWFIRLKSRNAGYVYTIDPAGQNLEEAYNFSSLGAFQYYLLDVTHDGSAVALTGYSPSDDGQLVRYENLAEGTSRSIRLPDEFGPSRLTFSPSGQYLLLLDGIAMSQFSLEKGALHVLDVTTSRLRPVDSGRVTTAAGWLSTQDSLIYSVFDVEDNNIGLYIAGTPGEPGDKILDGRYFPTSSRSMQPFWISSQNTFLASSEGNFYVNVISVEQQ